LILGLLALEDGKELLLLSPQRSQRFRPHLWQSGYKFQWIGEQMQFIPLNLGRLLNAQSL
jgi:hypothetical protein